MNLLKLFQEPPGDLIRRKLQYSIFRQKWNVGVTPHSAAVVAGLTGTKRQTQALNELRWMEEERSAFAADPFIISRAGAGEGYLIFFEYFPWQRQRGTIECVEYRNGDFGPRRIALDSPFHLSYPYIFSYSGKQTILPEHSASNNLSLYEFDDFGAMSVNCELAQDASLLDTTIIYLHGKYWIFATHAGPNDNRDLYIYYANDLRAPWTSHSQNPVKRDISNARPAGQFIHHADKLFRPAQDCSDHYGSRVVINEIRKLSEHEFEEVGVSEIRPAAGSRYPYGLHTISSSGDYTVIDGARLESSIHPSLDRLGRYILPQLSRK